MPAKRYASSKTDSTANLGFEAAALRGTESVRCGATSAANACSKRERGGVHQFGVPPKGNAYFAWVQHFIHHLAPQTALRDSAFHQCKASPQVVSEAKDNTAGVDSVCPRFASAVIANGSMSSNQSGEGDIRRIHSREMLSFAQQWSQQIDQVC